MWTSKFLLLLLLLIITSFITLILHIVAEPINKIKICKNDKKNFLILFCMLIMN